MFNRFFEWCRTLVSHGREWIEQQVLSQTKPSSVALVVGMVVNAVRSREELILENVLLRQQVVILKRSVKRVQPTNTDRRVLVWLTSHLKGWRDALLVVKPATILVWHRTLFRLYWRQKSRTAVGRPSLAHDTIELVKQMAADNRLWGAERIQGELLKLDIQLSKRTIQKYMRQARLRRSSGPTWTTFLHNHAHQIGRVISCPLSTCSFGSAMPSSSWNLAHGESFILASPPPQRMPGLPNNCVRRLPSAKDPNT